MRKVVRTHDHFYLKEDRYNDPKKMHVDIIADILSSFGNLSSKLTIGDFGCATGEFAYALHKAFPDARVEGYDVLPELLEKARQNVPSVRFIEGSVLDPSTSDPETFHICTCTGVLSIFDTFEESLQNILSWTVSGGRAYVQGLFNEFPLDVNIKYNHSEDYGNNVVEAGWNIFSKASVSRWLEANSMVHSFEFRDFSLDVDLMPQDEDPLRSWTFLDIHGRRHIINGLGFLQPHSILVIHRK